MEKLQWKTNHICSFDEEDDFLESMLKSYGVEDIYTFLHPSIEDENDPFLFKNMKRAVNIVNSFLKTNKTVFIKGDCDVDGVTSLSIIVQFLKAIKPNVKIIYGIDFNKRHGLFYSDLNKLEEDQQKDIGLIIVPDASLSKEEAGKIRKEDKYVDIPIIVLDHHDFNDEMDDITTVTVNCMDGKYPNPTLSGAGVVYKFGEAYCDTYELDRKLIKEYIDLASTGIISDSMDLIPPETRYIVIEGLKKENQKNLFLNELQERFTEDMKLGRTITNVGWVIAPKINGVIRYGKQQEQIDLFRAMCGEHEDIEYQPRRKHKEDPKPPVEIQSLQKAMARVAENVKARQDTEVRKFVSSLDEKIASENLLQNSVLFIDGTDLVTKNTVTGLIANKLASKYHRPVVLLKDFTEDIFGGSMRGYDKSNINNFKELLENIGTFSFVAGHANAAGIQIEKSKVQETINKCNELIPLDSLCTVYSVDWEIDANNLRERDVKEVANNYIIWGNTVPEPIFLIKNLHINAQDILGYGENNGFIRFVYKKIPFIKKYCQHDEYENMTCWDRKIMGKNKKDLTLNIIGQFILNAWDNPETGQIQIIPQVKILQFDSQENLGEEGINDSKNAKHSTVVKNSNKEVFNEKNIKKREINKIKNEIEVELGDFDF